MERAQTSVDVDEAQKFHKKLKGRGQLNLEDFLSAIRQTRKLGSLRQLISFLPGLKVSDEDLAQGQADLHRFEALVNSMTREERRDPRLLNSSRRKRIAAGSGTSVQDINRFIKQFRQMQQMTKSMLQGGKLPGM